MRLITENEKGWRIRRSKLCLGGGKYQWQLGLYSPDNLNSKQPMHWPDFFIISMKHLREYESVTPPNVYKRAARMMAWVELVNKLDKRKEVK